MALLRSQNNDHAGNLVDQTPICRSESFSYGNMDHNYIFMEKRQLFLRSYQFCRKRSLAERIKRSFIRVKRVIWFRLRSVRKLRRLVWYRLRLAFNCRRRRFIPLINHQRHSTTHRSSSCFG